jgi:hypothetical protein
MILFLPTSAIDWLRARATGKGAPYGNRSPVSPAVDHVSASSAIVCEESVA